MKKATLYWISLMFAVITFNTQAADTNNDYNFSDAELEQILAPIALYPDSVLTHILIASTYPLEVVQADRWVSNHSKLKPADAMAQVESKNWDPSVKALVPFAKILERMSDNLDWTQQLGDAFLQDEKRLLASIQSLRRKADKAGNLNNMEHMNIEREDDNIIIVPAEREIVYVPYYDTRVVYGSWYWNHYPPVYWDIGHHYPYRGSYYWYPRVNIVYNFFFSAFHWRNHHVVIVDRHQRYPRNHYYRSNIIRHESSRRWTHNPTHRRGVAYRSEPVKLRYKSSRPSLSQTLTVRKNEKTRVSTANRLSNQLVDSRNSNSRSSTVKTRTQKIPQDQLSRSDRLRQQLDSGKKSTRTQITPPPGKSNSRSSSSSSRDTESSRRSNTQVDGTKTPPKKVKPSDSERSTNDTYRKKSSRTEKESSSSRSKQNDSKSSRSSKNTRSESSRRNNSRQSSKQR